MEKKKNNKFLIILIALLLGAVVLKFLDISARGKAKAAFEQVNELLEKGEVVEQSKVHELIGEPSEGIAGNNKIWTDVYRYRGAFKSFETRVEYSDRAEKLLQGVSSK